MLQQTRLTQLNAIGLIDEKHTRELFLICFIVRNDHNIFTKILSDRLLLVSKKIISIISSN